MVALVLEKFACQVCRQQVSDVSYLAGGRRLGCAVTVVDVKTLWIRMMGDGTGGCGGW